MSRILLNISKTCAHRQLRSKFHYREESRPLSILPTGTHTRTRCAERIVTTSEVFFYARIIKESSVGVNSEILYTAMRAPRVLGRRTAEKAEKSSRAAGNRPHVFEFSAANNSYQGVQDLHASIRFRPSNVRESLNFSQKIC